jgi:hypothetical protein
LHRILPLAWVLHGVCMRPATGPLFEAEEPLQDLPPPPAGGHRPFGGGPLPLQPGLRGSSGDAPT